jgi:hypothetical protein
MTDISREMRISMVASAMDGLNWSIRHGTKRATFIKENPFSVIISIS